MQKLIDTYFFLYRRKDLWRIESDPALEDHRRLADVFYIGAQIAVDQPALPLRNPRGFHLKDNLIKRGCVGFHRAA